MDKRAQRKDDGVGGNGLLTALQVAESLGVSTPLARKWMWKLDMTPAKREEQKIMTKRGKRLMFRALYTQDQLKTLRKAIGI